MIMAIVYDIVEDLFTLWFIMWACTGHFGSLCALVAWGDAWGDFKDYYHHGQYDRVIEKFFILAWYALSVSYIPIGLAIELLRWWGWHIPLLIPHHQKIDPCLPGRL